MVSVVWIPSHFANFAWAVPVLRKKFAGQPAGFRVSGGPLIPIAAVLLCVALAWSARRADAVAGAVAVVVGCVLYYFRRPPIPQAPEAPAAPQGVR